jgi:RNA polymerase sigma-70 factor, ECF subfamily
MYGDSNLESLMALYQRGDFTAAAALIERISPQLYRFFAARQDSRAHAEDLLQETWLRIHKVRHTYQVGEPALPWFYAIARHVRVDNYRKSMRTMTGQRELEMLSRIAAENPENPEPIDTLDALLAPLSESQREVIAMLKISGMSLEEVARATSSSVGAVKQKAHRAYVKLRKSMSVLNPRKGANG